MKAVLILLVAFTGLAGCGTGPGEASSEVPGYAPLLRDVAELEARPDFAAAHRAFPALVDDALNRLALRDHAINQPQQ